MPNSEQAFLPYEEPGHRVSYLPVSADRSGGPDIQVSLREVAPDKATDAHPATRIEDSEHAHRWEPWGSYGNMRCASTNCPAYKDWMGTLFSG